jgi:hypothetical protein
MDAPQAEEVGPSQFTQAPPVGTQPTQPVGGATRQSAERHRLVQGCHWRAEGHRRGERHRPAEGHRMLQACRMRPWQHRLPTSSDRGWSGHRTPGRIPGTTPGLALKLLGRRGTDEFRCSSTFTMIYINYLHLLVDYDMIL